MVHNRKLAQDLRLAIARDADPELLVPIFSQDVGANRGRVKLSPYTMPSMRYERAKGMEINAVGGPVEWAGKFSVFVVVEKVREGGQWDRASHGGPSGWLERKKSVGTWMHCDRNSQSGYWLPMDPST